MAYARSRAKKDVDQFLRGTRSLVQKEVFEVNNAKDLGEVFERTAENIEVLKSELESRLQYLKEQVYTGEFGKPTSRADISKIQEAVFHRAFMDSVDIITDKAFDYLVTEAIRAVVVTQEFNYDLYVDHLLGALDANRDNIISIIPRAENTAVEVKVSLSSLGKSSEWGAAIQAYREAKKLGRIRDTKAGVELSSRMWREKYYGSAREGTKVIKGKPRKSTLPLAGSKIKPGKSNLLYQRDVTERYKGKYRETVAGRLAFIDSDKAPFWHLIEHGNIDPNPATDLGIDADGVPYPVFGPTNFVRNSEEAIASAFLQLYNEYLRVAIDFVQGLASAIESRERAEERARTRIIEQYREEYRPAEALRRSIDPSTATSPKMQAFVDTEKGRFEAYVQGNTVRVSLRDPHTGRYMKLPSFWKDLFTGE